MKNSALTTIMLLQIEDFLKVFGSTGSEPSPLRLFTELIFEKSLEGERYAAENALHLDDVTYLKHIPKEEFAAAFEQRKERLQKCIDAGRCYFEKI